MEGRKTDKTRVEEIRGTRREEGKKETNDKRRKNDSKNSGRKGE